MVELAVETKNRLKSRLKRKHGFSEDRAKEAVAAYEDFVNLLVNVKDFHAKKLIPPPIIDQVWRLHVLDTVNYEVDCKAMCGCIINYNPDLDVDLGSSERDVRQTFTNIAYDARFGERLSKSDAWKFDASVPNLPAYINDNTGQESLTEGDPFYGRTRKSTKPAKRASFCNVREGSPSKKKIISTDHLSTAMTAVIEQDSLSNSFDGNHNVTQTGTRTNSFQNVRHASSSDKGSFSVRNTGYAKNQPKIPATEPNTQKFSSTFSQSETPLESQKALICGSNVIEMDATKSVKVSATNGEVYTVYIDKTSTLVDVRSAISSHGCINPYLCRLWAIVGGRVSSHFYKGPLISYGFRDLHLEVPSTKHTAGKKVLIPQKPVEVFAFSSSLIPTTFNLSVKGNGNVIFKIKVTQETTVEDIKDLFLSTFNIKFALLKFVCPNQAQMIKQLFTIKLKGCNKSIHVNERWTVKNVKSAIMPYLPLSDRDIELCFNGIRLDDTEYLELTRVRKGFYLTVSPLMNGKRIKLYFS